MTVKAFRTLTVKAFQTLSATSVEAAVDASLSNGDSGSGVSSGAPTADDSSSSMVAPSLLVVLAAIVGARLL
jgi:hypothetical protein